MFTIKRIVSIVILFGSISMLNIKAQNLIKLSLRETISKATSNSFQMQLAKTEVEKMAAGLNKSLSVFLPKIILSETFMRSDDPLNVFGYKLKQKSVTGMDFNPVLLNNPDAQTNYNTSIDIVQPLINLDGFFGRAAASDGLRAVKFKKERTEKYLKFIAKVSYFKIALLRKSVKVLEETENTARANLKLFNDYYTQGLITKADLLKGEVFVSNIVSKKTEVTSQYKNESDNLKHLLNITENGIIDPVDTLMLIPLVQYDLPISQIIANRTDIKAYELKMSAMNNAYLMSWMKFLPRLNAFGNYQFNDTKAFGKNAKSWMVGINLRWNVFDGFNNAGEIQRAKAELKYATTEFNQAKSKGSVEITEALRGVETLKTQLELASKNVEQTKESLRIIKDRFEKGLEKTTDLLNSETEYSSAQLEYLKSLFMYTVSIDKYNLMTEIDKKN